VPGAGALHSNHPGGRRREEPKTKGALDERCFGGPRFSTLHSAHLCATVPNVRIVEIDVDDVPWKDELVDRPPVVEAGQLRLPAGPGWGAELNEAVAAKYVWEPGRLPGYSDPAMYRR
jgi:L-alanine-DL-glutamate epimerase-like enolase superfamily enzyme